MNESYRPTKRPMFAPRTVRGYHGCSLATAEAILSENRFHPSTNTYDWLGEGIYFWEYGPDRALDWARALCERKGGEPAVIGATLRLGKCLNLLDTSNAFELADSYAVIQRRYLSTGMPVNRARARYLDCAVIDTHCDIVAEMTRRPIDSVRGCFPEATPVYAGSHIFSRTHVQIAIRNEYCVSSLHLVHFG